LHLHGKDMQTERYVLITAARNEGAYIANTLEAVVSATRRPSRWVVVSDGSTDRTDEIVRDFARRHDFIELLRLDRPNARSFSSKAFALNAAYEVIRRIEFDFIGILDGDVSVPPDYYDALIAQFEAYPRMGLAGGVIVEDDGGRWELRRSDPLKDVAGAIQFFRRECYDDIGGLIPLRWGGIDTASNVMARQKGWDVRVFCNLRVRHHRPTGTAGVTPHRSRFRGGMRDYSLGYHPLFEIGKCCRRILERPYLTGSASHLGGYLWGMLTAHKPAMPVDFVRYLRREQMLRMVPYGEKID
jgi:poly-beta-1,6-N-acetyl-D-glucosamine synthase